MSFSCTLSLAVALVDGAGVGLRLRGHDLLTSLKVEAAEEVTENMEDMVPWLHGLVFAMVPPRFAGDLSRDGSQAHLKKPCGAGAFPRVWSLPKMVWMR